MGAIMSGICTRVIELSNTTELTATEIAYRVGTSIGFVNKILHGYDKLPTWPAAKESTITLVGFREQPAWLPEIMSAREAICKEWNV